MRLPRLLIRQREFVGHVVAMMSGKGGASIVAIVTMPIIARLFSPSDFGSAAVLLSLSVMVSNIGALRYDMALVLPKDEREALLLLALTQRILVGVLVATLTLILLYKASGRHIAILESLDLWLWYLPVSILLLTLIQIQENWLARKKEFKVVAASMVAGTGVTGGTRIAFGFLAGSSVFGLVIGHMFGQVSRLAIQKAASKDELRALFLPATKDEMRQLMSKYSDFPRLNAPASLLNSATHELPVVLFGLMFSPAVVGIYSMATRLTSAPTVMVANSVRRVFLQKAADIKKQDKSLRFGFLMATGALALVGAIPLGMLWAFGQPLASWLLGERWADAGRFLEILAPLLFMIWITAPSNPVFIVLRKQRAWLALQATTTLARLGAFGVAFLLAAGPEWTLKVFVAATVIGNAVIIVAAVLLIAQHDRLIAANDV